VKDIEKKWRQKNEEKRDNSKTYSYNLPLWSKEITINGI
jgi:hypothetical protein